MDAIPYPYHAPSMMQDGVSITAPARNDAVNKRRRIDGTEKASNPAIGSNAYAGWDEQVTQAQSYPTAVAPLASVSSYANATVTSSDYASTVPDLTANENTQVPVPWQGNPQSAAYPDLVAYQQQPYFHQSNGDVSYNNASAQSWSGTAVSDAISADQPKRNEVMPFFPSAASAQSVGLNNATTGRYDSGRPSYMGDQLPDTLILSRETSHYTEDANTQMKIQSLPILDNLATQLISTISKASYVQIQELMSGSESEEAQAYSTLKNLFDQTRKVYSRETPFIDAIAIQMFQQAQQEIIRKANIATFISSILGAHDVSFFHLNEFFMETFVPLGHRLLKWQGAIYLELKTQVYISALMNSDGPPEDMLDELFPADLDAQILTRHPDAPSLSPSEQDFIDRSRARKSYLLNEPSSNDLTRELPKKYQWTDFVREFASCISKNIEGVMNIPNRAASGNSSSSKNNNSSDISATANITGLSLNSTTSTSANHLNGLSSSHQSSSFPSTYHPDPNNTSTADTRTSKPNSTASATIRQPWTKPEEDALLAGLERVSGPHWSQILALYGRGGKVSEVLKDRNQVQLKDKARNLKLWYLKTGKELPVSLKGVTGELRKRGGARARAALGLLDEEDGEGAEGKDDVGGGVAAGSGEGKGKKKSGKKK